MDKPRPVAVADADRARTVADRIPLRNEKTLSDVDRVFSCSLDWILASDAEVILGCERVVDIVNQAHPLLRLSGEEPNSNRVESCVWNFGTVPNLDSGCNRIVSALTNLHQKLISRFKGDTSTELETPQADVNDDGR